MAEEDPASNIAVAEPESPHHSDGGGSFLPIMIGSNKFEVGHRIAFNSLTVDGRLKSMLDRVIKIKAGTQIVISGENLQYYGSAVLLDFHNSKYLIDPIHSSYSEISFKIPDNDDKLGGQRFRLGLKSKRDEKVNVRLSNTFSYKTAKQEKEEETKEKAKQQEKERVQKLGKGKTVVFDPTMLLMESMNETLSSIGQKITGLGKSANVVEDKPVAKDNKGTLGEPGGAFQNIIGGKGREDINEDGQEEEYSQEERGQTGVRAGSDDERELVDNAEYDELIYAEGRKILGNYFASSTRAFVGREVAKQEILDAFRTGNFLELDEETFSLLEQELKELAPEDFPENLSSEMGAALDIVRLRIGHERQERARYEVAAFIESHIDELEAKGVNKQQQYEIFSALVEGNVERLGTESRLSLEGVIKQSVAEETLVNYVRQNASEIKISSISNQSTKSEVQAVINGGSSSNLSVEAKMQLALAVSASVSSGSGDAQSGAIKTAIEAIVNVSQAGGGGQAAQARASANVEAKFGGRSFAGDAADTAKFITENSGTLEKNGVSREIQQRLVETLQNSQSVEDLSEENIGSQQTQALQEVLSEQSRNQAEQNEADQSQLLESESEKEAHLRQGVEQSAEQSLDVTQGAELTQGPAIQNIVSPTKDVGQKISRSSLEAGQNTQDQASGQVASKAQGGKQPSGKKVPPATPTGQPGQVGKTQAQEEGEADLGNTVVGKNRPAPDLKKPQEKKKGESEKREPEAQGESVEKEPEETGQKAGGQTPTKSQPSPQKEPSDIKQKLNEKDKELEHILKASQPVGLKGSPLAPLPPSGGGVSKPKTSKPSTTEEESALSEGGPSIGATDFRPLGIAPDDSGEEGEDGQEGTEDGAGKGKFEKGKGEPKVGEKPLAEGEKINPQNEGEESEDSLDSHEEEDEDLKRAEAGKLPNTAKLARQDVTSKAESEAVSLVNKELNALLFRSAMATWVLSVGTFPVGLIFLLLGAIAGDFLWAFKKLLISRTLKFLPVEKLMAGNTKITPEQIANQIKISAAVKAHIVAMNLVFVGLILSVFFAFGLILYIGCSAPVNVGAVKTLNAESGYKMSVLGVAGYSGVCEKFMEFSGGFEGAKQGQVAPTPALPATPSAPAASVSPRGPQ